MAPTPTGTLTARPDGGSDLVFARHRPEPSADVWAQLTRSEKTATWFGPWRGEPGEAGEPEAGSRIEVQMAFEEGDAWLPVRIESCDAPSSYSVRTMDEDGGPSWLLEVRLADQGDHREVRLTHHLDSTEGIGEIGPGWEYYMDLFAASLDGTELPRFEDYYPSMKEYFDRLG